MISNAQTKSVKRLRATRSTFAAGTGVQTAARGLGSGRPLVTGQEDHLGERDDPERDRRRALEVERLAQRLLAVDAEQHDHEEEEDHDRARVDDHLHGGDELRALEDEQHRDREERQHEAERGVHRVAAQDHAEAPGERETRRDEEEERLHQWPVDPWAWSSALAPSTASSSTVPTGSAGAGSVMPVALRRIPDCPRSGGRTP